MASAPPGDPRVQAQGGSTPVVPVPRGGPSWIVIAIGLAILGVLLFSMLDARRREINSPAVRPGGTDGLGGSTAGSSPPLYIPPAPPTPEPAAPPPAPAPAPPPQPQIVYVPQPAPQPMPAFQPQPTPPPRTSADPVLVVDTTVGDAPAITSTPVAAGTPAADGGGAGTTSPAAQSLVGARARVAQLANRSTTVPQGTLIPAVLETGLDSTRPGLARAMVTQDVRGFDGKQILIPRGSRLIGEYASSTQPGQNRALVNWIRLIRPDGATIAIGSPASDPVGRGGIKAKVNSHFFERFSGAILQSSLDIGVNLASRIGSGNSPVILALPGTLQNTTQPLIQQNQQIQPTLKVNPGTSITIFVARDLDFTGADGRR